jgi:hypothetical protein
MASINFQPSSVPIPSGYQKDDGSLYSTVRGYGWDRDLRGHTRDRNVHPDQRMDTLVANSHDGTGTQATWNYALPNGTYLISLASGDPGYAQGPHRVEVEGNVVVNNIPTTADTFVTITDVPVVVSDGQLTVKLGGTAGNSMLNYLIIKSTPVTPLLTVTKTGAGSGTVSSAPAGINCGSDCSESYPSGAAITLTAIPAASSTFSGWSGDADCADGSVSMSAAKTCIATFANQFNVKIGVFRPSTGKWYLDVNGNGVLDDCTVDSCVEPFGKAGDKPVVGDWIGNGTAQIGIFESSTRIWKLDRNGNDRWDGCTVDLCYGPLWQAADLPVVGRWTTVSVRDKIGIYRPSKRFFRMDLNDNGVMDSCTTDRCSGTFGVAGDLPVVGDWTSTGTTKMGVFTPSTGLWRLDKNDNSKSDSCTTDSCLGPFGVAGDLPVVGDWTGTGKAQIGVFDSSIGMWELDTNGNGTFDGCTVDACLGPFGQPGDLPIVGKW